jgi:hypothetical protein
MYSSQSTCVEVDWSGIKLSFIPFHSNTCGLKWIHMHPNKARVILCYPKIVTSSWQDVSRCIFLLMWNRTGVCLHGLGKSCQVFLNTQILSLCETVKNSYRFAILLLTVYFYMPVSHRIPLDSAAEQGTGKWIW